ncbi:TIGR01906 family membrane protein [Arthrobacter sp.]|uniref:TIGR01906 family membrane protein n=1 Tax=Arthrobacter sp. TaxID=1667 RepID=UPI0026E0FF27|nr:TIGR01906 family membrane protein [Arthrobacter sp.]MDO5753370.1 TIGR01906 family membrane protein [Arthrobacter sp.]
MSENSKTQDSANSGAQAPAPSQENPAPENPSQETQVPVDAAPVDPAPRIKVDESAEDEPMRPATRLPRLPSDEEIAASLAQSVSESSEGPATSGEEPTELPLAHPSAEEVARRQASMDKAANTKPVLTRVFQVLIAVFYPIVLLVLSIRLVTSSVFLWIEYHRPGFPADMFGFTTDDRVTYGSYTVDYLLNFASPRYLGDLVNTLGKPLFLDREVGHMADVKSVIVVAFLTGLVLAIVMVIGMVYLRRRSQGGIRRGLFAGSIATLALIIVLGVFAVTGWEAFFTEFHRIFFAAGTWTFYTDDTLIRLFPSQFWMDAGIFIGAFVLVVASLTLAFTWPTKDRRQAVTKAKRPGRRAAAV